ncbi:PepSY domain-containing protein [Marivita sp. XM-24bin2]|jgi:hypothetical protein|uniref:PepSY domain-containing protein n=1 Tax=unclassified Marivita TaxID=2632480 RepID=UPI000D7A9B2A|nr:PepSY domain-containing protein [Marivita sp. XM-24bin2]MCR9109935.1 PepSY domain-containing protein [Paracoccaceae bacterium]PWL36378.1 MAG: PepSY domain-containing protein [Marivita sp. XM-24bin2]
MRKKLISAVIVTFAGTMTFAQSATDQIINDLTGQGFERIEIDNGVAQIKVEAIRGIQKLEVVYDRATGNILKQEIERVDSDDDTRPGVEIRDRDRDFVERDRSDDDDDDRGGGRDEDDDDDRRGGRDDDDDPSDGHDDNGDNDRDRDHDDDDSDYDDDHDHDDDDDSDDEDDDDSDDEDDD